MGAFKNIWQNLSSQKGNNWKAIVLSVLAASVFWLFQSLNKDYSTNITHPLEFDFARDNYVIMDELPDEVQINVSGIGWNIFRKTFSLGLNPIRVHLENPEATSKIVGASLLANINDQLTEFQVNYVISDTLYLNIEPKASRTVHINVDSLSVDLKPDFRIAEPIKVIPDSVTLSGSQPIIEQLPISISLSLPQEDIDEGYEESIEVVVSGYDQSLFVVSPEAVNVSFDVDEYVTVSYKTQLKRDSITTNIYAIDSTVSVTYTLPRSAQASINKDQIEVVALPNTLNKEDSTVQLHLLKYPDEISEISLDSAYTFLKIIYE